MANPQIVIALVSDTLALPFASKHFSAVKPISMKP